MDETQIDSTYKIIHAIERLGMNLSEQIYSNKHVCQDNCNRIPTKECECQKKKQKENTLLSALFYCLYPPPEIRKFISNGFHDLRELYPNEKDIIDELEKISPVKLIHLTSQSIQNSQADGS